MKLDFDFGSVTVTEFGVGRDDGDGQTFVAFRWMRRCRVHFARWCRPPG